MHPLKPVPRVELPARLCNLDRLLFAMEARGLDAVVASTDLNVYYLSGFSSIGHKSDEPRPYAVILARAAPEHPIAVVAEYYLASFIGQPGWIEDIRPFRAVMMGLDQAPQKGDVERFIPVVAPAPDWLAGARAHYSFDMAEAIAGALGELGARAGRVGFDDLGFGQRLGLDGLEVADGYDALMFARAVKSAAEIALIERAQMLNQRAIEHVVQSWQPGMSWQDLNRAYHLAAAALGGYVRDPGGMVLGHPRGSDPALVLQTGREDFDVEAGLHIMFDCHGTIDRYCWDGGKTWVVDGGAEGAAKRHAEATMKVAETVLAGMRPGARVSELQALGRETYARAGVAEPARALIFFHGLGLSHMDLEIRKADGSANGDWQLEAGMVVPLHLYYPGGATERIWLEEVAAIGPDGGRPLFGWGLDPFIAA